MNRFLDQIRGVLHALSFRRRERVSWFGTEVPLLPGGRRDGLTSQDRAETRVRFLRDLLYGNFYCRGSAQPARTGPAPVPGDQDGFIASIHQAVPEAQGWEAGWRVADVPAASDDRGTVCVSRGGLTLHVEASRLRPATCLARGAEVEIRLPRIRPRFSPGFVFCLGRRDLELRGGHGVRLYWHLEARGAASWVQMVVRELDACDLGYHLKVLDQVALYRRCDAGVVYLALRDLRTAEHALRRVYADCRDGLRPEVPALTFPLTPGLGLALDPHNGDSFGQHRCGLLARLLVDAADRGIREHEARLEHMVELARVQGVDLCQPYVSADVHLEELNPWT